MDKKIYLLRSTTFADRRFSRAQLVDIQATVNTFTHLSLRELALTICENLNWVTTSGNDRVHSCLNALAEMQTAGLFVLPEKRRQAKYQQKPIPRTDLTDPQPNIAGLLSQWSSLTLRMVTEQDDIKRWNEFVDRYHYLGYKRPIGTHLRYFIVAQTLTGAEQLLGCLIFSYPVASLACRDQWIGWDKKAQKRRLNLVLNNNRFLIFPWVKVKNLASKVLAMATTRVSDDWMAQHGFQPLLMETFVDPEKFSGTCYKAANWQLIGQTKGRKGSANHDGVTPKDVYVYPLVRHCKALLADGKKPQTRRKTPNQISPSALSANDPFIVLWQRIAHIVFTVAEDFDQQWRVRKRIIDTRLLILIIFRLVLSKNKQGYGATMVELWDQCRMMDIPLPKATPVAQSSFSNARRKLDESIFQMVNTKIVSIYESTADQQRWRDHRVFAVDGTKINLPRQLLDDPYALPLKNTYYPQGLVSCLYQLRSKIPYDFELVAHNDERQLALAHLKVLQPKDLVIYDRGYFSYAMLYYHLQANVDVVFRLQVSQTNVFDDFFASSLTDQEVSIKVAAPRHNEIRSKHPDVEFKSLRLRLVKYVHESTTYVLGTSLLDRTRYPIAALSDLYHSRWGIEELYKISKELIKVEDFHGQTARGVKQELYAHFVLMTMNRVFANHADTRLNDGKQLLPDDAMVNGQPLVRVNMKNSLLTMARHLERLLLEQRTVIAQTINHLIDGITFCRQKERPGRKYERVSRRPESRWRRFPGKTKAAPASN